MSAMFWSRKLEGAYVLHEGAYEKIDAIRLDEDRPKGDYLYPEEALPHLFFHLEASDKWVRREEFAISFPQEGYRLVDNTPVFGARTMHKAYKLAPSKDSMYTSRGKLEKWLNAKEPKKFSKPEELFNWKKEHSLFSPRLMCWKRGETRKEILYCDCTVGWLVRTSKSTSLNSPDGLQIPPDITSLWPDRWDKTWDEDHEDLKLVGIDIGPVPRTPEPNGYVQLNNRWRYRPASAVDNYDYTVRFTSYGKHLSPVMAVRLKRAHDHFYFCDVEDMLVALKKMWDPSEALAEDLFNILRMHGLIPEEEPFPADRVLVVLDELRPVPVDREPIEEIDEFDEFDEEGENVEGEFE